MHSIGPTHLCMSLFALEAALAALRMRLALRDFWLLRHVSLQ